MFAICVARLLIGLNLSDCSVLVVDQTLGPHVEWFVIRGIRGWMGVPNLAVIWQSKRYFSGLERRHTGETLDEMQVSMSGRGCYLSGRITTYSRIGNENFETERERKQITIHPGISEHPQRDPT